MSSSSSSSSSLYRRLHGLFTTTTTTTTTLSKTPKPTSKIATLLQVIEPEPLSPPASSASPKDEKFQTLVKKFKKSSKSYHFRGRNFYYETTVLRLAAAKQFSHIEDILDHQKKYKDITDERFTVRLISLYGKSGMFDHAHKLFDEMPQLNCERTVMSFNALLAACINSKKFDKIGELFGDLPAKLSIKPNIVSYNTIVKAFCEMNSFDSALETVKRMENNGIVPDLITFNTLLDAFYRNNRFDDAEKLWVLMEDKSLVPNVRSYNPKLRGLVSEDRILEAIELIEEMGKKGVNPDVYSFNALIIGFRNKGNLEEAKRWFGEIEKSNCAPDQTTLKSLIPFACDKGDSEFAVLLFKEVIKQRMRIDTATMQLVVDALVKESKIEEAKELVELGKSNSYFHYKFKMPIDE